MKKDVVFQTDLGFYSSDMSSGIAGSYKGCPIDEPAVRNYFLLPVFTLKLAKIQQKTDFLGRFFRLLLAVPTGDRNRGA